MVSEVFIRAIFNIADLNPCARIENVSCIDNAESMIVPSECKRCHFLDEWSKRIACEIGLSSSTLTMVSFCALRFMHAKSITMKLSRIFMFTLKINKPECLVDISYMCLYHPWRWRGGLIVIFWNRENLISERSGLYFHKDCKFSQNRAWRV